MSAYYRTASRNSAGALGAMSWAPNRNNVRHNAKISLGPTWRFFILGALVIVIGLISVSQSARITSYDMKIAEVDEEITNLEAQRDALAVENAKLTAAAADEDSNTAGGDMVVARVAGYVEK